MGDMFLLNLRNLREAEDFTYVTPTPTPINREVKVGNFWKISLTPAACNTDQKNCFYDLRSFHSSVN